MEAILFIIFILAVLVVLGHGIWVLIAWLLRGCKSSKSAKAYEPTISDDRAATVRYLERLLVDKAISRETYDSIMHAVVEDAHLDGESLQSYMLKKRQRENIPEVEEHVEEVCVEQEPVILEPQQKTEPVTPPHPPVCKEVGESSIAQAEKEPSQPFVEEIQPFQVESVFGKYERPARRPWSEILASFMADKNIRWGELIGGLLILCCSTALVISLWSRIEAIPVLKFVIFTAMTAGLFGAGLFVYHRWRIPTTGQVVLHIATLLVPLNMLAFAAFSLRGSTIGVWTIPIEIGAVLLFAWLQLSAARVIIPSLPKLFTGGIVGISALSLLVRYVPTFGENVLYGVTGTPIVVFFTIMVIAFRYLAGRNRISEKQAQGLFLFLGAQTFACLIPVGLVLYKSGIGAEKFRFLSPLLCLLVSPALFVGSFIWQRLVRKASGQLRVVAACVTLIAGAIMITAMGLAWPVPSRLILSLVVTGLAIVSLMRYTRHKAVHLSAVSIFSAAWVLLAHVLSGLSWSERTPAELMDSILSIRTGHALIGCVVASVLLAVFLQRRTRVALSKVYLIAAGVLAGISILFVSIYGFGRVGDPGYATWIYLGYAVVAFALAYRGHLKYAVWCGAVLGQLAVIQMLVYLWPIGDSAWSYALLTGAGACTVSIVWLGIFRVCKKTYTIFVSPLAHLGVVLSLAAAGCIISYMSAESLFDSIIQISFVALIWLVLAFIQRWSWLLAASQFAMAGAVCIGVHSHLQSKPWFLDTSLPIGEPWVVQMYAVSIGILCLGWSLVRTIVNRLVPRLSGDQGNKPIGNSKSGLWLDNCQSLLEPGYPLTDRFLSGLVIFAMVAISVWSVAPGIAVEHGWHTRLVEFGSHVHSSGSGSWVLLAVVFITLIVDSFRKFDLHSVASVLGSVSCAIMLIAARYEPELQIINSLRWSFATAFLVFLAIFHGLKYLETKSRLQLPLFNNNTGIGNNVIYAISGIFAVPVFISTITLASGLNAGSVVILQGVSGLGLRVLLLGPAVLVAVGLMGHGGRTKTPVFAVITVVFTCLVVSVAELNSSSRVTGGITIPDLIWLVQVNAIISAGIAILWRIIVGWEKYVDVKVKYPLWPVLAGRAAVIITLFFAVSDLFIRPGMVSSGFTAVGTVLGVIAIILIEFALRVAVARSSKWEKGNAITLWIVSGSIVLASFLARFDTGNWVCFHSLMVSMVVAGGLRLLLGSRSMARLIGSGWQETFKTVSAFTSASVVTIDHDVTCEKCGYNLRGLQSDGCCPECGLTLSSSLETVVERLTPEWTGRFRRAREYSVKSVMFCVLLASLFGLRAVFDDPQTPWWSAAVLLMSGVLVMVLSGWAPKRKLAYIGGLEICLGASVWWWTRHWQGSPSEFASDIYNLVNINVVGLAVSALAWFGVERKVFRNKSTIADSGRWSAFHRFVANILPVGMLGLVCIALLVFVTKHTFIGIFTLNWTAWGAVVVLVLVCQRDRAYRYVESGLYLLGLSAVVLISIEFAPTLPVLRWVMSLALAVYVLATVLLKRFLAGDESGTQKAGGDVSWLFMANGILAAVSVLLGLYVSFTDPVLITRVLVAGSPMLCAVSALALVKEKHYVHVQVTCLALLSLGVVLFSWSWIRPGYDDFLIHRAVGLIVSFTAIFMASGWLLRFGSAGEWKLAVKRNLMGLCSLLVIAILVYGGWEGYALYAGTPLSLAGWAITAVIVSLISLIVCCIAFAVSKRSDPLGLSPHWKEGYVYTAEFLAGCIALHVRATMPWLFSGTITQYWPMLLMGLAFAAIVAAEVCARRGARVLARPLGRSGMFLPTLVLLELFLASSKVHYSVVLFTAGILYGVLASLRKSIRLGLLSALALNGSLWYLLYHSEGLGLTEHPQLWFIPPALVILVAGYLNRSKLTKSQRATIHYVCLVVVYLSSTADVFLTGVAQAPWLPLVLTGLSLVGILIGFVSRVKSFMLLGSGFLCLSLLTMIWHAASNLGWTWLWYVTGIVLGIGIITVFALFERKRTEMDAWLKDFKGWKD